MKPARLSSIALCLILHAPALAEGLAPTFIETAPTGHQKVWHATLDLRDLPPDSRPSAIGAGIDARGLPPGVRGPLRVTIAINGVVAGQRTIEPGTTTRIETTVEDRLLSTRNRVSVAVTALAQSCPAAACDLTGIALTGPIDYALDAAAARPESFAHYVTRFRRGVALEVAEARDRPLGAMALAAIAPRAPLRPEGPYEIVVSRDLPAGAQAPVRFDTGPVGIADRDGRVLYDRAALDRLTLVQLARRGDRALLWVRPGTDALPAGPLQLDYGDVALFGTQGREIAFAAGRDHAVTVAYAAHALREARTALYWRLAVAAVWLAASLGFVLVLRRMAPPRPAAA